MVAFTTLFFFFFSSLAPILTIICSAADIISTAETVRDGQSIVSINGSFELGFFSPGSSTNRFLGIWYKSILPTRTVVWVANRNVPLLDSSGVLKIIDNGNLVLVDGNNTAVWSTNTSRSTQTLVAQLLDSGNLVVKDPNDDNPENFAWQSFDYPSDTLLPGMKLGRNLVTGFERHLSSWRSADDPAPGDYTYMCNPTGYPQNMLYQSSVVKYASGPWNGVRFSGTPYLRENTIYKYGLVFNETDVYYGYELLNSLIISRVVLNPGGVAQRLTWIDRTKGWEVSISEPKDDCDEYGKCGAHGSCNVDHSPACGCLSKFQPKNPAEWNRSDWSNGCVRRTSLNCHNGEGFLKYSNVKLPDTQRSWFNKSLNLKECRQVCLRNCSCMAYANLDIRDGGSGCLLWFGDLLDIRQYGSGDGQDLFIRMASSELVHSPSKKRTIIIAGLVLSMGILLLGLILTFYVWKKRKNSQLKKEGRMMHKSEEGYINGSQKDDLELPLFDLATIAKSTDNFAFNNMLGEGGFGPVYKGKLQEGQEIAVKRLSKNSNQGIDEFKNEVIFIAKLQHRNLVRLLGCCLEGGEKMLIYEYMPNKSLDFFIFHQTRRTLLDWPMRFHIINGVARGLLYLHQDSRLRIIHRDLKASNILLDINMNPKISDFGIARSFGENETEASTKRVVGTHGYMSPEYAVDGLFSIKSDIFSFGVLVLEIVSGKRNRGFFHPDHYHNLLGHAWKLFNEGRTLELIDSSLQKSCHLSEILRSVHVSLLCVQQCPEDRPKMSSVALMLRSEGPLVQPKQPGFFMERGPFESDISSSKYGTGSGSVNEITTTVVEPR